MCVLCALHCIHTGRKLHLGGHACTCALCLPTCEHSHTFLTFLFLRQGVYSATFSFCMLCTGPCKSTRAHAHIHMQTPFFVCVCALQSLEGMYRNLLLPFENFVSFKAPVVKKVRPACEERAHKTIASITKPKQFASGHQRGALTPTRSPDCAAEL